MGSGASSNPQSRHTSYWCHQCHASFDRLGDGGTCPVCDGGFVEETADIADIAPAGEWLASGAGVANSTEARIARLLNDLHAHLEMVEGLHESMRRAMDASTEEAARPQLNPAPPEVLEAIEPVQLDGHTLKSMRQTAQCVVCCADFEAGEELSQLPGCGHLFHRDCVLQWLGRASNCPICRRDLQEAIGGTPAAASSSTNTPFPVSPTSLASGGGPPAAASSDGLAAPDAPWHPTSSSVLVGAGSSTISAPMGRPQASRSTAMSDAGRRSSSGVRRLNLR
mmetsp:Transcript_51085/g.143827  ORF Transcript_51085/g.143827 Transcript_51085/m.143827 type:complete len:281 (+) Transcript_51085:76-918(+)